MNPMRGILGLTVLTSLVLGVSSAPAGDLSRLHRAVMSNDLEAVSAILASSHPATINLAVGPGVTPIHVASALNHRDMVDLLIRRGADVDAETESGFTPLHWAASRDATAAVALLLAAGANLDARTQSGITALHWAAARNATNVLKILLLAGADIDAETNRGFVPLHWAVKENAEEAAVMLAYTKVSAEMEHEAVSGLPPADYTFSTTNAGSAGTGVVSFVLADDIVGKPLTVPIGRGQVLAFAWIDPLKSWAGKHEVSNAQYQRFKPEHDSLFREQYSLSEPDQPAVLISWVDAMEFCQWLNAEYADRLPEGWVFRLPSEREWVVLAKCGRERKYPWGDAMPPAYGNYSDLAAQRAFDGWRGTDNYDDGYAVTCPVAESGVNEWGLYGVGGNVWEWCLDWYGTNRHHKVRRGGCWDFDSEEDLRIETRGFDRPDARYDTIGFRVVISDRIGI